MKVQVSGLKEALEALRELPKGTDKRTIRAAMIDAVQPIVATAQKLAPEDEGDLKDSMIATPRVEASQRSAVGRTRKTDVRAFAGPNYSEGQGYSAPHAHLVEFGTSARYTTGGKSKPKGVYSGRMPAQPFMRPAFDAGKMKFIRDMQARLITLVDKAVRRAARRKARQEKKEQESAGT